MLKHILTGEELSLEETLKILQVAHQMKLKKEDYYEVLKHKHLALIFEKPSLRTRFSFSIAMRELGGDVVESQTATSKFEEPEDTARVLSGYCHALMLRTHSDSNLLRMAECSNIPVINGLSENHHPCQILADLMTLEEIYGSLSGLKISYIGDGNNILNSFLLLAPKLGLEIHYACPETKQPNETILNRCDRNKIFSYKTPREAVCGAHAVYTDVWTSMGFECDESVFEGFQVNEDLMKHAASNAVFMHCMPMCRGKEVSTSLPDRSCSVIFQQSENRLHIQKSILLYTIQKGFL